MTSENVATEIFNEFQLPSTSEDKIKISGPRDSLSETEYEWFRKTVDLAAANLEANEVPVACVIVYNNSIVGHGKNEVNATKNPTRHAEMCALDRVMQHCKDSGLQVDKVMRGCTLYVTMEPCVMCASAVRHMGVAKVVCGCLNDRFGGCGSVVDVNQDTCYAYPSFEYVCNVDAEECVQMMKKFYSTANPNVPESKCAKRRKNQKVDQK